jgi:CheY-like chemotaxis protein
MYDPPRILIVDDDHETNRDILATRLATQGYDLCQATDGQEALDAAKTLLPDLFLLDVMMPKLNGIEVCRRLRTAPDEQTAMRSPTRASEFDHRRLQVLPSLLHVPSLNQLHAGTRGERPSRARSA